MLKTFFGITTLKISFLSSLAIFLYSDAYIEGVCIEDFCIKDTCILDSYNKNTYIKIASSETVCIGSICRVDIYIKTVYINSVSAIECFKMYLQFFQILKIRNARLKIRIRVY